MDESSVDSITTKKYNNLLRQNKELLEHIKELKSTKTTEIQTGYFEKKITRHRKTKRERLVRFEKNPAKLSLGWFGNLEFFCYPYSSFDKIFIRDGNKIHGFDRYDLPRIFAIYNKARWVTEHGSDAVKGNIDSESSLARMIQNAFNAGLQQELIQDSKSKKAKFETKLKALENMKPEMRERWLEDDPTLKKAWERKSKSKSGGGH